MEPDNILHASVLRWQEYEARIQQKKKELADLQARQTKHVKHIETYLRQNQLQHVRMTLPNVHTKGTPTNVYIRFVDKHHTLSLAYLEHAIQSFYQKLQQHPPHDLLDFIRRNRPKTTRMVMGARQTNNSS